MGSIVTAADLAEMQVDMLDIRSDRAESITVRRGATTLAAQIVRIARLGGGNARRDTGAMEVSTQAVVVLGAVDLDIQKDDRFNDTAGNLYVVDFVRPNRTVATMAEARLVE